MANRLVFDVLANHAIFDGVSAQQIITNYSADRALTLLGECYASINDEQEVETQPSLFNFSPSSSLAGGPSPCSNLTCRIENAYNLSIFGSLYSDLLVLPNMFDYYFHYQNDVKQPFTNREEESHFLSRFANDVSVLFQYKPLLDAGIAVIHPTETIICHGCQRLRLASSRNFEGQLSSAYESMKPKLSKKIEAYRVSKGKLEITDSANYTGGSFILHMSEKHQKELDKNAKRYPYKLKTNEIIKSGLLDLIMQDSLYDLMEKNYYEDLKNTTFLTNRQIDADLIEASASTMGIESPVASSGLYHSLPFLHDILLEDIVNIRLREHQAFIVYRNALTKAMKESEATPDELANVYIKPALEEITNTIQNNKKYFRNKAGKTIIYSSVAVTAGAIASKLLNLPLSTELITTAGALLATPTIVPDLAEANSTPREARNDPYYFLWKIQKRSSSQH